MISWVIYLLALVALVCMHNQPKLRLFFKISSGQIHTPFVCIWTVFKGPRVEGLTQLGTMGSWCKVKNKTYWLEGLPVIAGQALTGNCGMSISSFSLLLPGHSWVALFWHMLLLWCVAWPRVPKPQWQLITNWSLRDHVQEQPLSLFIIILVSATVTGRNLTHSTRGYIYRLCEQN